MPYWLRAYLPLALLLSLVLAGYVTLENRRERRQLVEEQAERLERGEHLAAGHFHEFVSDLRFIARTPALQAVARSPTPERLDGAAELIAALMNEKRRYNRVSLIDADGTERLSLRLGRGGAERIADADLQRLSGRDYYERTRLLPSERVYVSRFDLEVERGQVTIPHQPSLRLALPLPADRGSMVLALHVDGNALLAGLARTLDQPGVEGMLLDRDGYWLYHPDPALRWGRQLTRGQSMPRRYPEAWSGMSEGQGAVHTAEGVFVYRRADPLANIRGLSGPYLDASFWLVLRIAPEALAEHRLPLFSALFVLLQIMALLGCIAFAQLREAAAAARERERRSQQQAAHEAAVRQQIREQIYQITLMIQAAHSPEELGAAVLGALAPRLGAVVAAFYRLEGAWLRPLAGYGLPEDGLLRQFRLGESLVGMAVRERREIQLDALPPNYLDVRSGLGQSPPQRLLIVPFWLRERDIGALELGLSGPLDEAQTHLLRQLIPLLSLHLANRLQGSGQAPGPAAFPLPLRPGMAT